MKIFILLFSLATVFPLHAEPTDDANCWQRRGALDIGSGSTKAFVAKVDTCHQQLGEILFEDQVAIGFNESFERSATHELSSSITKSAAKKMKVFVDQMRSLKLDRIQAVATSVFRKAKNGKEAAARLSKALDLQIRVISQEEEAKTGARAAWGLMKVAPQDESIVWDIGGGSMQMTLKQPGQDLQIFEGDLASVSFKNRILKELQHQDLQKVTSPNPLGEAREPAIQMARSHALKNVPAAIQKAAPKARWIGIGGVLSMSLAKQLGQAQKEILLPDLIQILKEKSAAKDADLEGEFKSTDVTNLALVLGYMQALGVQKVETVKASLGPGVVLE